MHSPQPSTDRDPPVWIQVLVAAFFGGLGCLILMGWFGFLG